MLSVLIYGLSCLVTAQAACSGYIVSGAGTADYNGCYAFDGYMYDAACFQLSKTRVLYRYMDLWKLGDPGHEVGYVAGAPSTWPPIGNKTWVQQGAQFPCPTLTKGTLPPIPPPPPPPPPTPVPPAPPLPPTRLVVSEDFNAPTLNTSLWNVLEQVHRGGVYTADNVFTRNGTLVLRTIPRNLTIGGKDYYVASGAVNTSGLHEQRYGKFSARVRLPDVDATMGYTLHSSIWLFSNAADPHRSGCPQEIDLIEQYAGGSPVSKASTVAGNLHPFTGGRLNGTKCTRQQSQSQFHRTADYFTDFHEFTVEWGPSWIAMYVDGTIVSNSKQRIEDFTDPLFYALTACVMNRQPPASQDVFPQEYLIDWVKIWAFDV